MWQKKTGLSNLLQPLSWIYASALKYHRRSWHRSVCPPPVVIVGNIVVGGSGKTLLLSGLIKLCQQHGLRVGVISRGYRGRAVGPVSVMPNSDPSVVGDEPLMIRQLGVPVVVAKRRLQALQTLLQDDPEIDLVLSDDGLQHYALPRDLELCLFDGQQVVGNGRMIPAGPMRESLDRLNQVDLVICKTNIPDLLQPWQPLLMSIKPLALKALPNSLADPTQPPTQQDPVIALCGIGQPESFFSLLRNAGWQFEPMALPDHAGIDDALKASLTGRTVLMTSKDAIKLRDETLQWHAWEVPVEAEFSVADQSRLLESLHHVLLKQQPCVHPEDMNRERSAD